ncbi:MAG: PspA/IM30 family protein [Oligoflexia bacterium]|nr:PspA/IM30 family protein [Oligoflexia bacterium]
MSVFGRLFTWGKSEANAVIDKLEDPVKMSEQGIIDLKKDLENSLRGLAEIKAEAIRNKRECEEKKNVAADYEKKAMLLLSRAQKGELAQADADRLAGEALNKKENLMKEITVLAQNEVKHNTLTNKLEGDIVRLKQEIDKWSTELTTLKARAKIATASKKINEQMAKIDSGGTVTMLEKMKTRVEQDEALAQSYGDIASKATSVDDEINKALEGSTTSASTSESLKALKDKMGINK